MKFLPFVLFFCMVASGYAGSLERLFDDHERIVGGHKASEGQFPWHISVMVKIGINEYFNCGGSLISDEWVLTAAHCLVGYSDFTVGLGLINLGHPSLHVTTKNVIIHENYEGDGDTAENDIGLLQLSSPINFTDLIKPIELGQTFVKADTEVTLSGFGRASDHGSVEMDLRFVNITTISNAKCGSEYSNVHREGSIKDSNICTQQKKGEEVKAACSGDSGGPLITHSNGKPLHVGITSWVHGNKNGTLCESGLPTVYTRTTAYLDWIKKHSGI